MNKMGAFGRLILVLLPLCILLTGCFTKEAKPTPKKISRYPHCLYDKDCKPGQVCQAQLCTAAESAPESGAAPSYVESSPTPASSAVSATASATAPNTPRIWLFALGVSRFANSEYNLKYAASDARGFYKVFRASSGLRLPESRAILLTDKKAKRATVTKQLTQMLKRAAPEDLVVIYLATHGLPDPDTGELNFLTYDTDASNLIGTGLSQSDINRMIDRATAGKILFVIDACHAGGMSTSGGGLARRGIHVAEVSSLLRVLAESADGVAKLVAASANETSLESDKWQGGLFTFHLIAGLKGKADANNDSLISLRELFDYTYDRVAQASNGQQHPLLDGNFDNHLPLVELKR